MPFVKFDPPTKEERCLSTEHNPPSHIVLQPGTHTYECPACGQKTTFTVQGYSCESKL